ncbi:MAG: lipoprotein-releasing ABC transporter permease subunit [Pelagibacterales bacterium]|nr:lipoprotein-releasing ABC transporter permease subunit [Pelagibacterales bacterium]
MISELEKQIAFRYLKTKKKDGFLNIISIFSFIGISLGVAVLIIVMSVMNGFRSELVDKIVGFNSHVVIQSYDNSSDQKLLQSDNIKSLSKNIVFSNSGEVVLINKNFTKGLSLRGYKPDDFKKLEIFKKINYESNENFFKGKTISIGKELSFDLNLDIGDTILLMSPTGEDTIIGNLPKQENYKITSIFDSGLIEFDQNVAFINIENLEGFLNLDNSKRNIEIYLNDPLAIEEAKKQFQNVFKNNFVYTWADLNKSLFSALKVERNVMFIILSLIIIVAAFNIISGLTILVKNKTKEIAILKSIGVLNKSITKIFFLVGFYIGTTATMFGILIGVLFSIYIENIRTFLSTAFNISLFPEEIYFLSKMPSEININSIILISICSILVTTIVSIFPATKASKLDPIKALKYE